MKTIHVKAACPKCGRRVDETKFHNLSITYDDSTFSTILCGTCYSNFQRTLNKFYNSFYYEVKEIQ